MKQTILSLFFLFVAIELLSGQSTQSIQLLQVQTLSKATFEQNKGQIEDFDGKAQPQVQYRYSQGGVHVFMLPNSIAYQFTKVHYPEGYSRQKALLHPKDYEKQALLNAKIRIETHRMDMQLLNANPQPQISAEGKNTDYAHYYHKKVSEVSSFSKLTYHEIYPHIDWVIYTTPEGLKYDFIVHPGGDPHQIQMRYTDFETLKTNTDGSFTVSNSLGNITEKAPTSLQGDKTIATNFRVDNHTILFQLGEYDATKTLVIDPLVIWATYYGDNSYEIAYSCTVDASDNVYLAGETLSAYNIAYNGHMNSVGLGGGYYNAFLVKFNRNGIRQWATYFGGDGNDMAYSCVADASDNVYLAGYTTDTQTYNGHQTAKGGIYDAFLVKFDAAGVLIWATYYGGELRGFAYSCAVDNVGNVYLAGETESVNSIAFAGHQSTLGGDIDGFLVKFNSDGVRQWGTYYGGSAEDRAYSCSADTAGNVYLTGITYSASGIATTEGFQNTLQGTADAFLVKFDANGVRQWGTYYGGTNIEQAWFCSTAKNGAVYIAGETQSSTAIASANSHQSSFGGGLYDVFLAKFDANGQRNWASYYGGGSNDYGTGCAVDGQQNIYLVGYTQSNNNIGYNGYQNTRGGSFDAFLVKFDSAGTREWGTYYGGTDYDKGFSTYPDRYGNVYLAGVAASTGLAQNGHMNAPIAGGEGLLVKFGPPCAATTHILDTAACNSYVLNDSTYTHSGTYTQVLANTAGCDSTITLNLDILEPSASSLTETACDSYTLNAQTYSASGSYTQTLTNAAGCDSTITLNLTINTVDTTVSLAGLSLTATASGAGYQWVDCTNNYAAINGETGQVFTATANGTYAVLLSENGCVDTSSCYTVLMVGLSNWNHNSAINLYPNPTQAAFTIDLGKVAEMAMVKIYNLQGQLLYGTNFSHQQLLPFEIDLSAGLYVVAVLIDGEPTQFLKLVKE